MTMLTYFGHMLVNCQSNVGHFDTKSAHIRHVDSGATTYKPIFGTLRNMCSKIRGFWPKNTVWAKDVVGRRRPRKKKKKNWFSFFHQKIFSLFLWKNFQKVEKNGKKLVQMCNMWIKVTKLPYILPEMCHYGTLLEQNLWFLGKNGISQATLAKKKKRKKRKFYFRKQEKKEKKALFFFSRTTALIRRLG